MGYVHVPSIDAKIPAANSPDETLEQFLTRILGKEHIFRGWFRKNSVSVEGRLMINTDGKTYIYDPSPAPKDEKLRVQKRNPKIPNPPVRIYRTRQRTKNGPVSVHLHGIHRRSQVGVPGAKAFKRLLEAKEELEEVVETAKEVEENEDEDGDVEMMEESVKVVERKRLKRDDTPALSRMDVDSGRGS